MGKHIVTAFSYPIESSKMIEQAKKIAEREELTLSKLIIRLLEEYVKVHGSGNPIYPLDKWQEPFIMTPAFGESMGKWRDHISKLKPNEIEEIINKADLIKTFARNYS